MPEWSKGVDLRPTVNDAWVRTPLQPFIIIFIYILYKNNIFYIKIIYIYTLNYYLFIIFYFISNCFYTTNFLNIVR